MSKSIVESDIGGNSGYNFFFFTHVTFWKMFNSHYPTLSLLSNEDSVVIQTQQLGHFSGCLCLILEYLCSTRNSALNFSVELMYAVGKSSDTARLRSPTLGWDTWIEFPDPSFNLAQSPLLKVIYGVNQWIESTSLCNPLSL